MSVRSIEAEVSIKSGIEAECSIGREVVVEVHEEAVLEPLTVTANGTYEPSQGVDGWDRVTVSVPERQPVTESLYVTANGQYMPSQGVDGFSTVSVAVPKDIKASGSFIATATTTNKSLDTGSTEWTRLLIVSNKVPPANSTSARAILIKYVDMDLDAVFTAFMSSAGVAYNAGSYRKVSTSEACNVENGVVSFSGEQASVGKFIKNSQYDWWAW